MALSKKESEALVERAKAEVANLGGRKKISGQQARILYLAEGVLALSEKPKTSRRKTTPKKTEPEVSEETEESTDG